MIGIGISLVSSLLRGGSSGMIGAFVAAYKALTDEQNVDANGNVMNLMPKGAITATSLHSTPIMAPDKDGVYQEYDADVPVYKGGRVDLDPEKYYWTATTTENSPNPLGIFRFNFNDGSTFRNTTLTPLGAFSVRPSTSSGSSDNIDTPAGTEIKTYLGDVTKVTAIYIYSQQLLFDALPDPRLSPLITAYRVYSNQVSAPSLSPDFSNNTVIKSIYIYSNNLIGPMPNISNLTDLIDFRANTNDFSGDIVDLSLLVNLTIFQLKSSNLTGYVGGWPNTPFLFDAAYNDLTEEAVNLILTEADTYGIASGTFIKIDFGTNAAPTGAGITAKNNLIANGATVITN